MEKFIGFIKKYKGAIIGILAAIIVLATKLYDLIIWIVVIVLCAFAGNYIQKNKESVKQNLKKFIDKM